MSLLRLGVSLQPRWPIEDGTSVLRAAVHAEQLGFDHVAVGNRLLDSGFGLDTDPLVLLSAVAGATTRLRLLTSVLVAPYYPALVLANQAATLDVVSGGRLILGIGTGWNPDEFEAVGVPSRERGARTDDHLAAARALWTTQPVDFEGQFTKLRAAHLGVPPVTRGGPPVWVGGHSDAALRRALRFGDGWYGTGVDVGEVTDVKRRLHELATTEEQADRLTLASAAFFTPPGIPAAVPSPGEPLGGDSPTAASVAEALGKLAEAGLAVSTLWMPVAAEHVEKAMEWIASEVMPQLA
ncbi:TIGR03619 family F420-dependent LLM class oxidoreductase [Kitasatospora sp. YST-16]|uniref:TIGR03619 family F420-dependent LLM class oxidoreductase n=1 Tax=Kitasatospora sp. YST-16 TaxID=2998080 RepID=UPI00228513C3|nr:TIGR03619 family F420-dependent LLM class oxidoreductase [Kitasatospora sp. YST-16]WAL75929.1 TIGR03619 family F420-dependent LLM class oxidoreductase [Kitasatospora sp. YST-16]WNW41990.1 TIGR03619 family F420-dependent LLM class oxidoreductase [Streptomyces sp. Li-HN-5-13]